MRSQFVVQADDVSDIAILSRGVPQGSVLGPLLFSLYINDLPDVVKHTKCSLYADDVQLLISGPSSGSSELINNMNADLASISNWSRQHDLFLNPNKSQYMAISLREESSLHWPPVEIDRVPVQRVETAKNLGVWFDQRFSWSEHIAKTCGKVYGSLRRLWKVAWAIPHRTRILLARSLVFPIISYASPVFLGISKMLQKKLMKAFNACVRFAFGLSRMSGTSGHTHLLIGCNLNTYFDVEACCVIFKMVRHGSPKYLADRLVNSLSERTLKLKVSRSRRKKLDNMLYIRGVKLWNKLPLKTRKIGNHKAFRKECTRFLNENQHNLMIIS